LILCRTTNHLAVVLSGSEASAFPTPYEKADLRLRRGTTF